MPQWGRDRAADRTEYLDERWVATCPRADVPRCCRQAAPNNPPMPASFEVSSRNGDASLCLREDNRDYFIAEVRGLNLVAHARVVTYMPQGLVELFADMATNWKGWNGAKTWASLEGELELAAEMDKAGHVGLTVRLRKGAPAAWAVTVELLIEAGQLDTLARSARS